MYNRTAIASQLSCKMDLLFGSDINVGDIQKENPNSLLVSSVNRAKIRYSTSKGRCGSPIRH